MTEILREQGIVVEELKVDWKFGTRRASDREWYAAERMDGVTTLQNDTLAKWFRERDYRTRTSVCLIVCGHHYVVVKGHSIADNQQGKVPFAKSRHKRKRVTAVYRLSREEDGRRA
jgi:hypothetical protein